MKDLDYTGKYFYFEDVPHLLGKPIGMGKKLSEMKHQIERKGYTMINPEIILHLSGSFSGRILVEIENPDQYDANVDFFENARILTRVYKGSLGGIKKGVGELVAYAEDRTHIGPSAIYYWHVSCPICAKQSGSNKVVLFARV